MNTGAFTKMVALIVLMGISWTIMGGALVLATTVIPMHEAVEALKRIGS